MKHMNVPMFYDVNITLYYNRWGAPDKHAALTNATLSDFHRFCSIFLRQLRSEVSIDIPFQIFVSQKIIYDMLSKSGASTRQCLSSRGTVYFSVIGAMVKEQRPPSFSSTYNTTLHALNFSLIK